MPRIAELIKNGPDIRFKKSDSDIIDLLMEDTKKNKLEWYGEDDMIYTKVTKNYGETKIDTIFKISDQLMEDEYGENEMFGYEFQDMFSNVITLDIYMSKNGKKEIFCRRISIGQLKLSNLLEIVLPDLRKKSDKK